MPEKTESKAKVTHAQRHLSKVLGRFGRWGSLIGVWVGAIVAVQLAGCNRQLSQYASLNAATQYVGSQACSRCHNDIAATYAETGMGRSLYVPSAQPTIEDFGPNAHVYDPLSDFHYRPTRSGTEMYLQEFRLSNGVNGDTVYQRTERLDYVVGSGHQTRSYLLARNGYLFEAPITWYVHRQTWDLSPGYHNGHNSRFSRPIGGECLSCHTGVVEPDSGTFNRYTATSLAKMARGIGCEKCHGPGSAHVAAMQAGEEVDVSKEVDYSIVNPAKLPLAEQFDVCQQCHLQGVQVPVVGQRFRPGQRLAEVSHIFLPAATQGGAMGIAGQAERLRASACFLNTNGTERQLTCTTCHDPHQPIATTPANFYREACQGCHAKDACTAPLHLQEQKANDCASCHMPKRGTADIPHVRFTDHKIQVVGDSAALKGPDLALLPEPTTPTRLRCATCAEGETGPLGTAYVQYFQTTHAHPAYLKRAQQLAPPDAPLAQAQLQYALGNPKLAYATAQGVPLPPLDQYFLAQVALAAGKPRAALESFETLYARYPGLTEAGLAAVVIRLKLGAGQQKTLQRVLPTLQQLKRTKPFDPAILTNLAFVELNLGRKAEAETHLQEALQFDPDHVPAWLNLAALYAAQGNKPDGRAALARVQKLAPTHPQLAALQNRLN